MDWILGLICGVCIGWIWAHNTVANECDRLGSFYVGERVYKCERIEVKDGK